MNYGINEQTIVITLICMDLFTFIVKTLLRKYTSLRGYQLIITTLCINYIVVIAILLLKLSIGAIILPFLQIITFLYFTLALVKELIKTAYFNG